MSSSSSRPVSTAAATSLPTVRDHTDLAVSPLPEPVHAAPPPNAAEGRAAHGNDEHGHEEHGEHAKELDLPPIGTLPVVVMTIVLIALLAALFFIGWLPHHRRLAEIHETAQKKTQAAPIVGVAIPQREKVLPSLVLPGATRAFQSTAVYPRAAGYIKKLYVDIGDHVEAGQTLVDIETPEIDAQLAASQATLEQARANATRTKSDFELAQSTLTRYQGFAKTGGVTQQQIDEKQSAADQAKSAAAGADATVKADEADVQRLAALQGFQKVVAPFSGTITQRNYDVGALLSATTGGSGGSPLFQIDQTDTLRVFVDVPQSYADQVHVGEKTAFIVRNFPNKPFEGLIARTAAALDEQTRTLRVEADFPNKDGTLLPGMYGQVKYDLKQDATPFVIPSGALIFGAEGTRVAVVGNDNKVSFKAVSLGRDLGAELEVTGGLNGDERIVANPGERLADGVQVTVADSNKPGAASTPQGSPTQAPQQQASGQRQAAGQ